MAHINELISDIGDVKALRAGLGYLGGIPVWRGGVGVLGLPTREIHQKFFPVGKPFQPSRNALEGKVSRDGEKSLHGKCFGLSEHLRDGTDALL